MKKLAMFVALVMLVMILCACGATDMSLRAPASLMKTTALHPTQLDIAIRLETSSAEADGKKTEEHWYDEHVEKMKEQSADLVIPADGSFLDAPESKTVLGSKGYCIYELFGPSKDSEHFGKAKNGNTVTILARQNDYALFLTEDGIYAWGIDSMIVDRDDEPYLVSGKKGEGVAMVMSHDNKVCVMYDPYCVFARRGTMAPGTAVTAYRTVNGFTYVECGAIRGWVASKFLT